MKNEELDKLLKSLGAPNRPTEYWDEFPKSVIRELRRADVAGFGQAVRPRAPRLAWGLGLATACVVVGLTIGFRWGRHSIPGSAERVELNNYLREIETLFPRQIQAIVFDESGPRLILSEKPDVPNSPAVFVRICAKTGCRSFITFSGQRVRMNGDEFEVLVDAQGGVIVVGLQSIWSSVGALSTGMPYRITAQRLEVSG